MEFLKCLGPVSQNDKDIQGHIQKRLPCVEGRRPAPTATATARGVAGRLAWHADQVFEGAKCRPHCATVEFHGSACGRCNCFRGAADSFNVQRGSTRSVDMLRWNAPVDPRTLAEAHRAVQASKPAPCLRMFGKRPAAAGAPLDLAVAVVFELSCLAEASKTTDTQNSLPPKLTVSPAAFFFRLHHVIIPQSCFQGSGLIRLT